jgi:hypothetical protein
MKPFIFVNFSNGTKFHSCTYWLIDDTWNHCLRIESVTTTYWQRKFHPFESCSVATPLWDKCEDETHTLKSEKTESSETPKNLELDCRGQISSHLSVLGVIEKVLKCKCPKWPRWAFGHLQPKLWAKERLKVKLAIWLSTTKSRESTSFQRLQKECDIALESSQGGLQLWFRPCFNWTLQSGNTSSQIPETPT